MHANAEASYMSRSSKPKTKHAVIRRPGQQVDQNQRYSIIEGSELLRLGRSKLYGLIKSGKLAVIKEGARTYVPGSEIIRLSTLRPTSGGVEEILAATK